MAVAKYLSITVYTEICLCSFVIMLTSSSFYMFTGRLDKENLVKTFKVPIPNYQGKKKIISWKY